jgi:uncharacterized membrane protein
VIVGLIVSAPVAEFLDYERVSAVIYGGFSYLCHQIPERSFHFAAHKFAVCSRCTGLYSGLAAASLVYPLTRSLNRTDTPRIVWLILATIPLIVDFALTYFGIWQNNHFTRFVTGGLLGAVAVFYLVPGLIELSVWFNGHLGRKR